MTRRRDLHEWKARAEWAEARLAKVAELCDSADLQQTQDAGVYSQGDVPTSWLRAALAPPEDGQP